MFEYKCTIERVVDGDTVDAMIDLGFGIYHRARIRLASIDCPETRTTDLMEKAAGLLAKRFLTYHLGQASQVTIKTSKDGVGKYGRILGTIYADGDDLNWLLVSNHLAVPYHGERKGELKAHHLANRIKLGLNNHE